MKQALKHPWKRESYLLNQARPTLTDPGIAPVRPCKADGCIAHLRIDNTSGLCRFHRVRIEAPPIRTCGEKGCDARIRSDNESGFCGKHWDAYVRPIR